MIGYRKVKVGEPLKAGDYWSGSNIIVKDARLVGEPFDGHGNCYRPITTKLPQRRIPLMRICEDIGLTCDQYKVIKGYIYNNYRRRKKPNCNHMLDGKEPCELCEPSKPSEWNNNKDNIKTFKLGNDTNDKFCAGTQINVLVKTDKPSECISLPRDVAVDFIEQFGGWVKAAHMDSPMIRIIKALKTALDAK